MSQQILFAVATFLPMLIFLVVVHELGHFFTAKFFGVKVLEFGIGYPPKALGFYTGRTPVLLDQDTQFVNVNSQSDLRNGQLLRVSSAADTNGNLVARIIEAVQPGDKTKGPQSLQELGKDELLVHEGKLREVSGSSIMLADMLYSLNWTPLGGFVKLAGESNPAVPKSLASRGVGPRAVVLAAGSFMNAILPIVIFSLVFMIPQDVAVGNVAVTEVQPDSPAQAAGILPGDVILFADGVEIESGGDLVRVITLNAGSEMEWVIQRGSKQQVVRLTPRTNPPEGQGATGIGLELINQRIERRSEPPWTAVGLAFSNTWEMLVLLKQEVFGWITGTSSPELSGPVGIAQLTGEVTQEAGLRGWLVLAVLLSINLAILNILPIPMLDGGRLLFVGIEWVRGGKRVPPDKEGMVHLIGFVLLIGVILLITANDIFRLVQNGSVLGG